MGPRNECLDVCILRQVEIIIKIIIGPQIRISRGDPIARVRYNRIFQNLYLLAFLGITLYSALTGAKPEQLVILGQFINGLVNTPLLMIGILYLAFTTDKRLRMSSITALLLIATAVAIIGCIVMTLLGSGGH